MNAPLLSREQIAELVKKLTPEQIDYLRDAEQQQKVMSSSVDDRVKTIYQQLDALGLVDQGHETHADGPIWVWVSNSNGKKALHIINNTEIPPEEPGEWLKK